MTCSKFDQRIYRVESAIKAQSSTESVFGQRKHTLKIKEAKRPPKRWEPAPSSPERSDLGCAETDEASTNSSHGTLTENAISIHVEVAVPKSTIVPRAPAWIPVRNASTENRTILHEFPHVPQHMLNAVSTTANHLLEGRLHVVPGHSDMAPQITLQRIQPIQRISTLTIHTRAMTSRQERGARKVVGTMLKVFKAKSLELNKFRLERAVTPASEPCLPATAPTDLNQDTFVKHFMRHNLKNLPLGFLTGKSTTERGL
jgi:hypothetical protein